MRSLMRTCFGVTFVSTRAAETWLMARSSSSAAICSIPVVVPWPSSTLPMNTVAVLSACTAIHESRSSGSGVAAAAGTVKEPDGEQVEFKLWLSDDVPGSIVKQVRTTRAKGEVVAETTITLQSYKKAD